GAADSDTALADVVRETGTVLGYGLTFDAAEPAARRCQLRPLPLAIVRQPGEDTTDPYFHALGAVCNLPVLAGAAARSGFLNAAPDTDGILRRAPLIAELEGRIYPSFALSIYAAVADASHPVLNVSTVNASTLRLGDLSV